MANEVMLDTSALVEYADGTEKGRVVKDIVENQETITLIPSIVLGELISLLERRGITASQNFVSRLEIYTLFVDLEPNQCIRAGKRHAELRKNDKSISLVDCIIMEIAEEHNAVILTTDTHFKYYKNARIL